MTQRLLLQGGLRGHAMISPQSGKTHAPCVPYFQEDSTDLAVLLGLREHTPHLGILL